MEQLLKLRAMLKKLSRKELKELKTADRKEPGSVWRILRCVYGLMDYGLHWSLTLIKFTDDLAWNGSERTKLYFAELLAG
jgi:hypothetical protein